MSKWQSGGDGQGDKERDTFNWQLGAIGTSS